MRLLSCVCLDMVCFDLVVSRLVQNCPVELDALTQLDTVAMHTNATRRALLGRPSCGRARRGSDRR